MDTHEVARARLRVSTCYWSVLFIGLENAGTANDGANLGARSSAAMGLHSDAEGTAPLPLLVSLGHLGINHICIRSLWASLVCSKEV